MADIENPGGNTQVQAPVAAPVTSPKSKALAKWAELEPETPEAKDQSVAEGIGTSPSVADKAEPKVEEKKPEPDKDKDDPKTPEIAALARREKFQREQHARRMQELRTKEQELNEKLAKVPGAEFASQFERDPVGTLKKYGVSAKLANAAKAMWLAELGDAAPERYKEDVWKGKIEAELRAKDEELAALKRQRQEEAELAKADQIIGEYRGGMRDAFSAASDSHPHVKALMGHDAKGLLDEVWGHVVAYGQKNPDAELPTPDQVLDYAEKLLESRARPFRAMMGPKVEQTGQKAEPVDGPPTLSDRVSAPTRANPTGRSLDEVKSKLKDDLDRIPWDS